MQKRKLMRTEIFPLLNEKKEAEEMLHQKLNSSCNLILSCMQVVFSCSCEYLKPKQIDFLNTNHAITIELRLDSQRRRSNIQPYRNTIES